MTLSIHGLGTARPPHRISQSAMARAALPCSTTDARQQKLLPALYRRAQVHQRHVAVLNRANSPAPITNLDLADPAEPAPRSAAEVEADEAALHQRMLDAYPAPASPDDHGPTVGQRLERYPEEALTLAAAACRAALADAGREPVDVRQLVLVTCTGFAAPGVDIGLIDQLGLPTDVGRTTVGFMGCHGAMNGLRVARGLADGLMKRDGWVLMCCVELCSLHFQYGWDPQKIVANSLFSDGAAAVMGCAGSTNQTGDHRPSTTEHLEIAAHGSCLLPESRDAMTWLIRDHGFEMTLSPRVPDLIHQHLRVWLTDWLAESGLQIDDIRGWAIHPGGPRVVTAVEDALDLPLCEPSGQRAGDPSRDILRTHGNMSSPTILFILDRLRRATTPRPWVALAFGPGLTVEAVLIR